MAKAARRPADGPTVNEVIMGLVERVTRIEDEFMDPRWEQAGANFAQLNENLLRIHSRLEAVSERVKRLEEVQGITGGLGE